MSELVKNISQKLDALEKGQLPAEEIEQLTNDSRELNERLVVLRYKAYEGKLITRTELSLERSEKTKEVKQEEERVIEGFKINLGSTTETKEEKSEPVVTNQINLIDVIEEETKVETVVISEEISVSSSQLVADSQQPTVISQESVVRSQETIVTSQKLPINIQQSNINNPSLNEKLSVSQPQTLAEKLQKKPISDLKAAIGLNQKFLFMNDLFEGENSAYNEAINKLNAFSTIEEAKNHLLELGTRYKWTLENENVVTFTELVERRYA